MTSSGEAQSSDRLFRFRETTGPDEGGGNGISPWLLKSNESRGPDGSSEFGRRSDGEPSVMAFVDEVPPFTSENSIGRPRGRGSSAAWSTLKVVTHKRNTIVPAPRQELEKPTLIYD
jgi:hypothetical protein